MTMDFADILNTLDSRLPCGEDLEYDADFLQLQRAAAKGAFLAQHGGGHQVPAEKVADDERGDLAAVQAAR